ncbi:MAG: DUF1156 domain-containing protein [Anaerolineales bacterium]|nr:DUF1156 domain-containing protein [Anaerolineales bacterium]
MTTYRKKLIEVALPLDAINAASAREKSIRHGHPSTLHLWWARRPLAACRAVLFAQLVDDPSEYMPDEQSADEERQRLFELIEELVKWENINNEEILDKARLEIARSVARDLGVEVPVGKQAIREFLTTKAPPVLDPFAGGGSIPLEAQRLGLRAYASDLNPVAVLINKALIEIPPRFAGMPPVHPPLTLSPSPHGGEGRGEGAAQSELWKKEWKGAEGLAEDVRYYGKWMRDEAEKRIGHLYPKYKITQELLDEREDLRKQGLKAGDELTVIAWLWARTVKCPNPACGAQMPLVRTFVLSSKKAKEAWIEPLVEGNQIRYTVKVGNSKAPEGTVSHNSAYCICCDMPVPLDHVRAEGQADRMSARMIAIVAEGKRGRIYLPPNHKHEADAASAQPAWEPEQELQGKCRVSVPLYGMNTFGDLFTSRQLCSLNTFSNLISDVHASVSHRGQLLNRSESEAYANAIATYLAFVVDYGANYWSKIATLGEGFIRGTFVRQAIAMVWDYAEGNPFGKTSGNWGNGIDWIVRVLANLPSQVNMGIARMADATKGFPDLSDLIISTDPPYYDNIEYADLSDYFYTWMRRNLRKIYPDLFSTLLTSKNSELVASPWRFQTKSEAEDFFEDGLRTVFQHINTSTNTSYPVTIYYAFKQSENEDNDQSKMDLAIASTGWETMLEGLINSDFEIVGTWPMRTERPGRSVGLGANALASSIVLVCRPRSETKKDVTRRDFLAILKRQLPHALHQLQQGSIAPVDLAQAAIGPGMAVFSRYKQVLEADGSPMSVRTALALINQALDEFLAEQEGEYDADTRWALAWYEQYGFNEGPYGVAETLSKAKNTSVGGLEEAGVLLARAGKVRLLSRTELKEDWDPTQDKRPTAWEAVQHLIRALDTHGEQGAARLLSRLGGLGETARDLAYRLYTICERKGWAQDALGYNMLVVAWPRLKEMARHRSKSEQETLL